MRDYVETGVKPGSAAFDAGLKEGQQVTGTSVYWNDVSKPVKLAATDGVARRHRREEEGNARSDRARLAARPEALDRADSRNHEAASPGGEYRGGLR